MPSVVPFRGDYGFHDSFSALKRIQEDMNLHAHNIANANTRGFNPNSSVTQTLQEDQVSISGRENSPSRVNLTEEASRLKENEQYYKANAKAIKVQNDILGSMLDLKV